MLFLACINANAFSKQIALTFDDAPRSDGQFFSGVQRTHELIKQFRISGVRQAAFFCNTKQLSGAGKNRIRAYADAGHVIANHTDTHPDLHQVDLASYKSDIRKAHEKLESFATFRRWFRFPFLREGDTQQKRDGVRRFLKKLNYINGYVTVDTYDWYMEKLFQDALREGRKVHFDRLRKSYLRVISESVEFYDDMAQRTLGRSPNHVLLLHENDLAALFVADLVQELQLHSWSIIPVDLAYEDPLAAIEPDTFFLGQGRVAAIAHEKGYPGPFSKWESELELERFFEAEKVFE